MKAKNLIFYKIPYNDPLWMKFRTVGLSEEEAKKFGCSAYESGIGASEISNVLNLLGEYDCPQRLYHEKVGDSQPTQFSNEAMVLGRKNEELVRDIWRCWDGTEWVERFMEWDKAEKDKKNWLLRNARNIGGYIVNPDYKQLFCSLDYYAEKGSFSLITGEKIKEGFPLEIKCISSYFAKKWLENIPRYHVVQLHLQMLITGASYGEIAVLIDGKHFECKPFERDESICDEIIKVSTEFWNRVKKGREFFKEKLKAIENNDTDSAEKWQAEIDSNEPEISDGVAYEQYLKEKYKKEIDTIEGGLKEYKWCKDHIILNEAEKILTSKKQYVRNLIIKRITDEKAGKIDFGEEGYFTYLPEGKRTTPTPRINLKYKPDKNKLEEEIDKLNFDDI